MLASYFIADGIDAAIKPAEHVEKFRRVTPWLERAGLPPILTSDATLLARVSGAVSAGAGVALALGKAPRTAALVLAAANIPITLINFPFWAVEGAEESKEARRGLLRGLGMGGGLILAATDRAGQPSLSWKLSNFRDHRAEIKAVKSAMKSEARNS